MVRCPVHGERTDPSLSLRTGRDGTLGAVCHGCGWTGDALSLIAALDGLDVRRDFRRVLERAADLAGGFVRATVKESLQVRPETPRLPEDVAAELFKRICERGRLRARGAVEAYLERRGLLAAARYDGWATLPSLNEMLDVARGMCEESGPRVAGLYDSRRKPAVPPRGHEDGPQSEASSVRAIGDQGLGALAFGGPEKMLVAARLARRDREGRLRMVWGRHCLVIPWRWPGGRIQSLQRRIIDKPRVWRGQEEPRYVLPWAPRWPYGVERLGGDNGTDCVVHAISNGAAEGCSRECRCGGDVQKRGPQGVCEHGGGKGRGRNGDATPRVVVFVEGAVDALAMRLLRPGRCVPLGLPGTGAWESSWARLVGQRKAYFGTDGDASGDARAAKAAIDVAEAQGRIDEGAAHKARAVLDDRLRALAQIKRDEEQGRIAVDVAAERRAALGPARCVLCGEEAELLCRGCGRVRPRGKDWGEMWLARAGGVR